MLLLRYRDSSRRAAAALGTLQAGQKCLCPATHPRFPGRYRVSPACVILIGLPLRYTNLSRMFRPGSGLLSLRHSPPSSICRVRNVPRQCKFEGSIRFCRRGGNQCWRSGTYDSASRVDRRVPGVRGASARGMGTRLRGRCTGIGTTNCTTHWWNSYRCLHR